MKEKQLWVFMDIWTWTIRRSHTDNVLLKLNQKVIFRYNHFSLKVEYSLKTLWMWLLPVKMIKTVCKYHQEGYCKFGQFCHKRHVVEACKDLHCEKDVFIKRHPAKCKYFMLNEFCKVNTECAYEHVTNNNKEQVEASAN